MLAQPKRPVRGQGAPKPPLREMGEDPETGKQMVVKDGRWGPYVTDGETNASLRKGDTVEELTDERAIELLADRRAKGPAKKRRKKAAKKKAKKASKKKAKKAAKKAAASPPAAGRRRPRGHRLTGVFGTGAGGDRRRRHLSSPGCSNGPAASRGRAWATPSGPPGGRVDSSGSSAPGSSSGCGSPSSSPPLVTGSACSPRSLWPRGSARAPRVRRSRSCWRRGWLPGSSWPRPRGYWSIG